MGAQTQKKWGPKGEEPEVGTGPEGWEAQYFDFPSGHNFHSFFRLLGVFSWNFGRGSRPNSTQSARLGFSGVILCEPRRPTSRRAVKLAKAALAQSGCAPSGTGLHKSLTINRDNECANDKNPTQK